MNMAHAYIHIHHHHTLLLTTDSANSCENLSKRFRREINAQDRTHFN